MFNCLKFSIKIKNIVESKKSKVKINQIIKSITQCLLQFQRSERLTGYQGSGVGKFRLVCR